MVILGKKLEGVASVKQPLAAHGLDGLTGPVGRLPLLQITLAEHQERALLENGVRESADASEAATSGVSARRGVVWYREDVCFSAKTLQALLEAAGDVDLVVRIGGQSGAFAAELGLSTPDEPLLAWLAGGGVITAERLAAAEVLTVEPKEQTVSVPLAAQEGGLSIVELPLTECLLLPCGHWLQLLWANLLGLAPFLWRSLAGKNIAEAAWSIGWAIARARSIRGERVMGQLGRRGQKCRIHPSAVVEGCWLGDDVKIGANAVVRGCVLGDGAEVEDLALAEFSVLGPGAVVQRQGMLKLSVAGAGSSIGGVMQLGVLEARAAVKRGALMMDMSLGQQLRVRHRGVLTPAPLGFAGVCVGQGTTIGAGVQVAGGRAIPAGLSIVAEQNVIARIPESMPGPRLVVRNGTLEAL